MSVFTITHIYVICINKELQVAHNGINFLVFNMYMWKKGEEL